MRREDCCGSDGGLTLIEVLFAMAILLTVAVSLAPLFVTAARVNLDARTQTAAIAMAVQKVEQLRSLTWGCPALSPSPPGSLQINTTGYVDYLDPFGNPVGTGLGPPPTARYVRRWSVEPLAADPDDTLVLQVLVTTVATDRARQAKPGEQPGQPTDGVRMVSVRTRMSP